MGNKLYIGNLSYGIKDQDLNSLFSKYGEVLSAKVITDRDTGRSKGFGFVEMGTDEEAQKAISELDGNEIDGRPLKVNEAKPREPRGSFGSDRNDRGNRSNYSNRGNARM